MHIVSVPAGLSEDLRWQGPLERATEISNEGKKILWEFDFGKFSYRDPAAFQSFTLAVEEFVKRLYPLFEEQTAGVILCQADGSYVDRFPISEWGDVFEEWKEGKPTLDFVAQYRIFCTQMLAEYLHRLASFLPETLTVFALFDLKGICPGLQMQLLSKERFEHIELSLDLLSELPQLGICLPPDSLFDQVALEELEGVVGELIEKKIPFRGVPESKLNELWNGLDQLIVFPSFLSVQGKRKLAGFVAAGGGGSY